MAKPHSLRIGLLPLAVLVSLAPSSLAQTITRTATAASKTQPADAAVPSLKSILDRNAEVMGGRTAWSRLTSQEMTGVYQTEDGSRYFSVEILAKSPNKSLFKLVAPDDTVIRDVCDGHNAWVEDPRGGYHEFTGPALAAHLRRSEFLDRGKALEKAAATGKVAGTAKVGPYVTYVVEFASTTDLTSRIYFDSDTGYIVRTEDVYTTPDGPYNVRMDFADYRAIDGMKFPFRMRSTQPGAVFYIRLTQLKNNVYIDDSTFLKPESAAHLQP